MVGVAVIVVVDLVGLAIVCAVSARVWAHADAVPYDLRNPLLALWLLVEVVVPAMVAVSAASFAKEVVRSAPSGLVAAASWVLAALATPFLGWELRPSPLVLRMHGPLFPEWMAVGAAVLLALSPASAPLGWRGVPVRAVVIWAIGLGVGWAELTLLQMLRPPSGTAGTVVILCGVLVVWVIATAAAGAMPRPVEWRAQSAALIAAALAIPLTLPEAAPTALRALRLGVWGWELADALGPLLVMSLIADLIVVVGGLWVYLVHRGEQRRGTRPAA